MILKNREIKQWKEMQAIIQEAEVCYVGFADDDQPYVLPFNFSLRDQTIYLHSDNEGHKLEVVNKNPKVCINFNIGNELFYRHKQVGCSWGMKYKSVNAFGSIQFIEDYDEKYMIMKEFMQKYAGEDFEFSEPAIKNVKIMAIQVEKFTGKKYGY